MSARAKGWSIGLLVAAALAGSLGRDVARDGLGIPLALLGLAFGALVAEIAALLALARGRGPADPWEGSRPADGVVEVLALGGVEGVANPASPRFRAFLGRAGEARDSPPVAKLPPSRPRLRGQVALVSVFVGRDGSPWTDREIARGHASLERAGLWIEREAGRRSAGVNVGLADAYFVVQDDEDDEVELAFAPEGDDVGPMEARAGTKAIIAASRAAARLGFADVVDLMGRVGPGLEADAVAWLFHIRRSGRSLAIPAQESDLAGVGLALCYSREASFPGPLDGPGRVDPTTVAHELLHLFGASDKYGVPLRSFPEGLVGSLDIMRLGLDRLDRMTIGGLTASEVGWGPGGSTKTARR